MRIKSALCLFALSLTAALQPTLASGTSGGGLGSGSGSYQSAPRDPVAEAYSRGKSMVAKRIACKNCAFAQGIKDTATAQLVAARVRAGEFDLKPEDRGNVLLYLSRRFGV